MDEEVVLLEEQLAAAAADVEQLQSRLADAESRSVTVEAEASELRRQLEGLKREAGEREQSLQGTVSALEEARAALSASIAQSRSEAGRYREIVLAHEPELPAELVTGDSITAIDEAVSAARQTVAQVRQHLEQQAQAHRVPTGAPVRGAPDFSALTPSEKIRLGLQSG